MFTRDIPELAIVRVLTAGGPYEVDDLLSVAFATPTIGRLVAHERTLASETPLLGGASFVPDTISVRVTHPAPPYGRGAHLTLSFVDPRVARIHPTDDSVRAWEPQHDATVAIAPHSATASIASPLQLSMETESAAATIIAQTAPGSSESPDASTVPIAPITPLARNATIAPSDSHGPSVPNVASERIPISPFAPIDAIEVITTSTRVGPSDSIAHAAVDPTPTQIDAIRDRIDAAVDARYARAIVRDDALAPEYERTTITAEAAAPTSVVAAASTMKRSGGVCVRLQWSADRVRRFVLVVDKLFTVDRLGWYRHLFAMRLLVPDEITCGDAIADIEAMRYVVALRAASVETLGRPLLAAFMPNFTVTPEWLDSLDSAPTARALAGLREAIVAYVEDDLAPPSAYDPSISVGIIDRNELVRQPATTVESLLPLFIATHASDPIVTQRLHEYRRALVEVFGQTAQSAEAVRLKAMSQPNHALDDRLWQLVGAVGETLGGLAVA